MAWKQSVQRALVRVLLLVRVRVRVRRRAAVMRLLLELELKLKAAYLLALAARLEEVAVEALLEGVAAVQLEEREAEEVVPREEQVELQGGYWIVRALLQFALEQEEGEEESRGCCLELRAFRVLLLCRLASLPPVAELPFLLLVRLGRATPRPKKRLVRDDSQAGRGQEEELQFQRASVVAGLAGIQRTSLRYSRLSAGPSRALSSAPAQARPASWA